MTVQDNEDFRNIYCCYDDQETARLVQILRDAKLDPMVRDRSSSAFPTTVGHTSAQIVAVAAHEAVEARSVIENAIRDEVISSDGDFIDSP